MPSDLKCLIITSSLKKLNKKYENKTNKYGHAYTCQLQSNLVISNSLISNYRLSRSENLVPVLT